MEIKEELKKLYANYFKVYRNAIKNGEIPEASNISVSQQGYLETIYHMDTPTFGELADEIQVTKPAVTVMVRKFINEGFVEKIQAQEDGRIFRIKLTEKGMRIVAPEVKLLDEIIDKVTSKIEEKKVKEFSKMINEFNQVFESEIEDI